MKKYNLATFILLAFIWVTTQSVNCRRPRPYENCGNYRQDSVYFKIDVSNQAATFTLADSISISSRISDTIAPVMSSSFIYPLTNVGAVVQVYKVVPAGGSYQLNFANIEFNINIQTGTYQPYQGLGYNLLYTRNQPSNALQFSLKPGVVGLYVVVVNKSYNNYASSIRNPNDDCVSFTNNFSFPAAKQNLQYWNTLGLTSIALSNSNFYINVNKNDKNYFFVKIN